MTRMLGPAARTQLECPIPLSEADAANLAKIRETLMPPTAIAESGDDDADEKASDKAVAKQA